MTAPGAPTPTVRWTRGLDVLTVVALALGCLMPGWRGARVGRTPAPRV